MAQNIVEYDKYIFSKRGYVKSMHIKSESAADIDSFPFCGTPLFKKCILHEIFTMQIIKELEFVKL